MKSLRGYASSWCISSITTSQGIASLPEHASYLDELVVIADRAIYRAKAIGWYQVANGIPTHSSDTQDLETS